MRRTVVVGALLRNQISIRHAVQRTFEHAQLRFGEKSLPPPDSQCYTAEAAAARRTKQSK
jgi:hypothetical protein